MSAYPLIHGGRTWTEPVTEVHEYTSNSRTKHRDVPDRMQRQFCDIEESRMP